MNPNRRIFVKNIAIICPVRNVDAKTQEKIQDYVRKLEKQGHRVHWPPRDNDQSDPIGIRICKQMRQALKNAHEIHVWYEPESEGTIFDLGMLFAFLLLDSGKEVVIINRDQVGPTPHKSFQNVLLELAR